MPPALRRTAGCPSGQRERSVKPSAQPTLVRTQHLPPPAKTARWLRKRGPAGRFLLVTPCIRVCHCGSMHGSVRVHMVYSVRAKLAVRITARSRDLAAVRGGRGTSQYASRRADSGLQICQGGTKASSCPGGLLAADSSSDGSGGHTCAGREQMLPAAEDGHGPDPARSGQAVAVMCPACTAGTPFMHHRRTRPPDEQVGKAADSLLGPVRRCPPPRTCGKMGHESAAHQGRKTSR